MKLALIGIGGLGCRAVGCILDEQTDTQRAFARENALVCDIARAPTDELEAVPDVERTVIGDTSPHVTGDGIDGGPELAAQVTRNDLPELRRTLDSVAIHESDAVLVVVPLGTATGSGTGSVLVSELQETYDVPVYVLGVLPADDDDDESALLAARGLRTVVPAADSTLLFDGELWDLTPAETDGEYDETTDEGLRELATRVIPLFSAGERDRHRVAENAVDSSDIIRTLDPGGVASVGYASATVEPDTRGLIGRLLSWLGSTPDTPESTDAAKVKSLVQQAANGRLTVSCDITSTERALVVLSGPPSELSRRGFVSARQWLEDETDTVEILAGDDPRPRSSTLEVVVLFSNVTTVPRIDALQSRAVARQRDHASDGPSSDPH